MGNSNSSDENENEESLSIWQRIANGWVIMESVIYIGSHLLRIYNTYQNPEKDRTNDILRYRETLYVPNIEIEKVYTKSSSQNDNDPIVPEGVDTPASSEDSECIICATNEINTVFMPCGHLALCITCSKIYHENSRDDFKCIICKQNAIKIKRIFKA